MNTRGPYAQVHQVAACRFPSSNVHLKSGRPQHATFLCLGLTRAKSSGGKYMQSLKLLIVVLFLVGISSPLYMNNSVYSQAITDAPTGFDNQTNGFTTQTQFDADRIIFEEREGIDEGLGPLYNATACSDCHQNPVTGAISQITELRAGHFNGVNFVDHPGGSLINDRAINANIQERVLGGNE